MKNLLFLCLLFFTFSTCKQENQVTNNETKTTKELSIAQKIANAHGYDYWKKVKSFEFRFGGSLDNPNSGRFWKWQPKTNNITLKYDTISFQYNRLQMDSIAINNDKAFINDKFWALIPFQLIWDEGLTFSEVEKTSSPIKKEELNKLTITYSNEGGYTPGDAYDIFFDDNYIIKEWVFRKGNNPEPSLTNTFETYSNYGGIKIARDHKKENSDWNLLLRDNNIEFED
jgi:hypothetical protein